MIDIILDALLDTARLIPFLFLTYLAMEYLEHKTGSKTRAAIERAGKWGPLAGGMLGAFPQCGFSAAAASLYAGGVISLGTLLSVFLSTSDEMLPVMISGKFPVGQMAAIVGGKVLIGVLVGITVDFIAGRSASSGEEHHIEDVCEHEHCHCDGNHIVRSALHHTGVIAAYIFAVSFVLSLGMEWVGPERLTGLLTGQPIIGHLLCGIVGMIPNCAASVVITELYMERIVTVGMLFSGLLAGSGTGLLVLLKVSKRKRSVAGIAGLLYAVSLVFGLLIDLLLIG